MTRDELLNELLRIAAIEDGDEVSNHIEADRLLLQFINDEEVTKAFNTIDKWYE